MKKQLNSSYRFLIVLFLTGLGAYVNAQDATAISTKINLAGKWDFQIDSLDKGITERWFTKELKNSIQLPGSLTTNGIGSEIKITTPWTGGIVDSAWYTQPQFAPYRKPGNIKVPFWLQPDLYYTGAAWYQKKIIIPKAWNGKRIVLTLERTHWETMLWVDGKELGMRNSLSTPHTYLISNALASGEHTITIRVDNRVKDINVGLDAHSITDHTQSNWNGVIGEMYVEAIAPVFIGDVRLFPDNEKKQVLVRVHIVNTTGKKFNGTIALSAQLLQSKIQEREPQITKVTIDGDSATAQVIYSMGDKALLWDEFHPNVYTLKVALQQDKRIVDEKNELFGLRKFIGKGTEITINNRPVFLRGTLECAIFPKTGFPPTDTAAWMRICRIAKSYGLNHIRFHSWCPPKAAFIAADISGIYLQIECASWANGHGVTIGDGLPVDKYVYEESECIVKEYGNHPSFCMMVYGNEPGGKKQKEYLTGFVNYWKAKDNRRMYTSGAGWPVLEENDYNNTPWPRIQQWGEGLKSIINSKAPSTDFDWGDRISKWKIPTVSHEIGQWCVYPDFKEIKKYTGVLKAKNFEIFQDFLSSSGTAHLADSFLIASGKLQVLCYKADIEAALRTRGFGGFQLLDLHDFPGQGTALVGVLNPFWEDKGYVTGKEYSRFCNEVVPLARMKKLIYENNDELVAQIQVANFSEEVRNENVVWNVKDEAGKMMWSGVLPASTIPLGNSFIAGGIKQSLATILKPGRFVLTAAIGKYENSWDFFVYPSVKEEAKETILVTQQLEAKELEVLNSGGKVLLTIKKGSVRADKGGDIQIGFSSIFWNTAWTKKQAPVTLGILCNPNHPAFKEFPTQYHSNYQWQDAMRHSQVIQLDAVAKNIQPIVRVIDDWFTARPLALVFECAVGKGKLIVSGIDLVTDSENRPEAKQLLHSLKAYMATPQFKPAQNVEVISIQNLLK
jgi:Glycosyl hydrolases family 2, sugar binding domain/Glycosyl hydrolases family 2